MLLPLALVRCGGSDNSDIGADAGRFVDAGGLGGARGDASEAGPDSSGPRPGCPPVEPVPGVRCPSAMLVCTYGDRICVCSMEVSWVCFDPMDGSAPDSGRGGSGGAGGGGTGGSSIDG